MEKNPYNYTLLLPIKENYLEDEIQDEIQDEKQDEIQDEKTGTIMEPEKKTLIASCIDWYNNITCCSIYLTL